MKHHISSAMANSGPAARSDGSVGFRFHPTDDELVIHFLKKKLIRPLDYQPLIPEVKVCDYEPWDLPGLIDPNSDDQVWYFFCPRDYKYLRSRRSNRTTEAGYWKPTGKPRKVLSKHKQEIASKRSLVFYIRGQPKPFRTKWVMHEYECALNSSMVTPGSFVLFKLKSKADEKAIEDQSVHMVSESDLDNQNLSDVTVNSSCDEHQSSTIHISLDFKDCNTNDTTTMSIYENDKQTYLSGINSENQNFDEVIPNCVGNYIKNKNPNEMAAMSTSVNGKLNCFKRDIEGQNPLEITDISAIEKVKWSPHGSTPDNTSVSSNFTNTDIDLEEVDPLLNYVNGLELEELVELVGNDTLFCQLPMSPIESSSNSSFFAEGKGHEIGWENGLFSMFT